METTPNDKDECVICYESLFEGGRALFMCPLCHQGRAHLSCAVSWSRVRPVCPMCNQVIEFQGVCEDLERAHGVLQEECDRLASDNQRLFSQAKRFRTVTMILTALAFLHAAFTISDGISLGR